MPAPSGRGWDQTARSMGRVMRAENQIGSAQIANIADAGGTVGLPQFVNPWCGLQNATMVAGMVMVGGIIANKSANDLT